MNITVGYIPPVSPKLAGQAQLQPQARPTFSPRWLDGGGAAKALAIGKSSIGSNTSAGISDQRSPDYMSPRKLWHAIICGLRTLAAEVARLKAKADG